MQRSGSRRHASPPPSTPRVARSAPTSSGGHARQESPACHALELAFVFVFDNLGVGAPITGESAPGTSPTRCTGVAAMTPQDRAVMTLDVTSELAHGPRSDELALWDW